MKSMNRFMLLTVLTFCTLSALATEDSDKLNYAYETYTDGTTTLPYRKAEINVDEGAGVKPLLAIYLHGGSSRGNDNELQMQEPGKDSIANYLLAHKIPAILVVPQCPAEGSWGGQMLAVVYGMLKQFTDARQVNLDRVYIFGRSMGGTGTWSMLSAYPGFFAAVRSQSLGMRSRQGEQDACLHRDGERRPADECCHGTRLRVADNGAECRLPHGGGRRMGPSQHLRMELHHAETRLGVCPQQVDQHFGHHITAKPSHHLVENLLHTRRAKGFHARNGRHLSAA